jgi:hypothetical protein
MADVDTIVTAHGGAQPDDDSFANVVAVDEEVIIAIALREKWRRRRLQKAAKQRANLAHGGRS